MRIEGTNIKKIGVKKIGIFSWSLYDWASSAFHSIIITFIFASYFTEAVAKNKIIGTAQWGHAIALAGITVAVLSPIFGAIADNEGRRKPWLFCFTLVAVVATALLWYVQANPGYVNFALACIVIGTIGIEIAVVFYNAMMRNLVPKRYIGRLSGWSWGLGYLGGLICLIIALLAFVQTGGAWLHLNTKTFEHIRISGPLTAIWYFIFALPLFIFTPDQPSTGIGFVKAIKAGLQTLIQTIKSLRRYMQILKFLLARMIYMDGLNTLFAFAGIYAAGTFGMSYDEIIKFGIALNLTAGIGAVLMAWLDDWYGSKKTILIGLIGLIATGTSILFIHSKTTFWIIALILGLFVGPVQAASRSLMARIVPENLMTEMFGLYSFSGKITAFLGPSILSLVTVYFHSQRVGMSTVMILLVIGAILLWFVKLEK